METVVKTIVEYGFFASVVKKHATAGPGFITVAEKSVPGWDGDTVPVMRLERYLDSKAVSGVGSNVYAKENWASSKGTRYPKGCCGQ